MFEEDFDIIAALRIYIVALSAHIEAL